MVLMDNNIYLQLKEHIKREAGQAIYLEDIAGLACSIDIKDKIGKLLVQSGHEVGITTINAVDIVEIVRSAMPSAMVFSIGAAKVSIHLYKEKESRKSDIISLMKVALTGFLLFIGSGLAIMYFHADVNMHEVHEAIYSAVTGEKAAGSYWISIPYSIGIGLGIALFFGIFPNKKRSKTPDPMEIGIYKYRKDIDSYLEYKEGQKSEDQ